MAEKNADNMTLLDKMSSEMTPATSPLLEFLTNNIKLIVLVLVGCCIMAGGYGFYTWNQNKKAIAAQDELARILILEDNQDKLAKLKTFISGSPEAMRSGLTLALARTAMKVQDYSEASQAWDTLTKNPKDAIYAIAMIGKAESLSHLGKTAEALALLESMTAPSGNEVASLVNILIVSLAEQTGDYNKSIAACEKIISNTIAENPQEAEYWRLKANSLRLLSTGKS